MKKYFKNRNKGFTMIEMMIAISIFLIVIMIGSSALLNANLVHNKSKNMRSLMDNLSFILEDISKNIRTGSGYQCINNDQDDIETSEPKSCVDGWVLVFESSEGNPENNDDQWVYAIYNNGVYKSTTGVDNLLPISSDDIKIDVSKSGFTVIGAESNDKEQPLVTIRLTGSITYGNTTTPFSIQTSVSQRVNDINIYEQPV